MNPAPPPLEKKNENPGCALYRLYTIFHAHTWSRGTTLINFTFYIFLTAGNEVFRQEAALQVRGEFFMIFHDWDVCDTRL